MMKKLMLLLMLMIPCNSICSQDTLRVTSDQIKVANIIFSEHQKFSEEIPLLEQQIDNLEQINRSWKNTDSINKAKINQYKVIINNQYSQIDKLEETIKNRNRVIKVGSRILAISILCLLLK